MALVRITDDLLYTEEFFDIFVDAFDSIKEVGRDELHRVTIFRVMNDEIPKEDKPICFKIGAEPGVKPFVIEWDI